MGEGEREEGKEEDRRGGRARGREGEEREEGRKKVIF